VTTHGADGLTALADPTRRAIFEKIVQRPRAVGELALELPVGRPAVSQHLRVLREAKLVTSRAVGTRRIYEVDPAGLAELRAFMEQFWNRALAAYRSAVEQPPEETR
jgi:DNA-binding transcriptional ArsR family regulator